MSNLWLNISLGGWHLQIGPDRPFIRVVWNSYIRRPWWKLILHTGTARRRHTVSVVVAILALLVVLVRWGC